MSAKDPSPPRPSSDPDFILGTLEGWGVRLELDRVQGLLSHLGSPQERYATVLVAGTNGKGSTAALLASMAVAAGYRTGLFTSPHLEGVEERLRIDGEAVGRRELGALLEEAIAEARAAGLEPPTYFEALTVAASLWFARSEIELAVFEVGMGGRLDATNACSPELSLVSEIGLDHVKPLGATLSKIAREKAGIFRSGKRAIIAVSARSARAALRERAREIGADLSEVPDLVDYRVVEEQSARQRIEVDTAAGHYDVELGLPGEHQVRNLALAVSAAEALARSGWAGFDRAAIERGVGQCAWPGRLERIALPEGKTVWLDVAHNHQGARALARFVAKHLEDHDLLFGVLADKDARRVLGEVAAGASRVILTRPPGERGLDPSLLTRWVDRAKRAVEADPEVALEVALEGRRPLVVCGSLYLVGYVRRALRNRFGVPAPAENLFIAADSPTDTQA